MPAMPLKFERRDNDNAERYIATDTYGREFKIWWAHDHGGSFGLSIDGVTGAAAEVWKSRCRHQGILWLRTKKRCVEMANDIARLQMGVDTLNPPRIVPHRGDRPPDILHPSLALLMKLGSIIVHVEEAAEPGGHEFDMTAVRQLLLDPEVRAWRHDMGAMLPLKRSTRR